MHLSLAHRCNGYTSVCGGGGGGGVAAGCPLGGGGCRLTHALPPCIACAIRTCSSASCVAEKPLRSEVDGAPPPRRSLYYFRYYAPRSRNCCSSLFLQSRDCMKPPPLQVARRSTPRTHTTHIVLSASTVPCMRASTLYKSQMASAGDGAPTAPRLPPRARAPTPIDHAPLAAGAKASRAGSCHSVEIGQSSCGFSPLCEGATRVSAAK